MYLFNYEELAPVSQPSGLCVVPQAWLSKRLPTMGGEVIYVDTLEQTTTSFDFVCKFSDVQTTDNLSYIVSFQLQDLIGDNENISTYGEVFNKSIKYRAFDNQQSSDDWCIEVVLLNHIVVNLTSTATNQSSENYFDFKKLLLMSENFNLEFSVNENIQEIIPSLSRKPDQEFGNYKCMSVTFFSNGNLTMKSYKTVMNSLRGAVSIDSHILVNQLAMNQEKMLISTLAGL